MWIIDLSDNKFFEFSKLGKIYNWESDSFENWAPGDDTENDKTNCKLDETGFNDRDRLNKSVSQIVENKQKEDTLIVK